VTVTAIEELLEEVSSMRSAAMATSQRKKSDGKKKCLLCCPYKGYITQNASSKIDIICFAKPELTEDLYIVHKEQFSATC
jgi:hypothetical protein